MASASGFVARLGGSQWVDVGNIHVETWTENGCLMLLVTSPRNEMLR